MIPCEIPSIEQSINSVNIHDGDNTNFPSFSTFSSDIFHSSKFVQKNGNHKIQRIEMQLQIATKTL